MRRGEVEQHRTRDVVRKDFRDSSLGLRHRGVHRRTTELDMEGSGLLSPVQDRLCVEVTHEKGREIEREGEREREHN